MHLSICTPRNVHQVTALVSDLIFNLFSASTHSLRTTCLVCFTDLMGICPDNFPPSPPEPWEDLSLAWGKCSSFPFLWEAFPNGWGLFQITPRTQWSDNSINLHDWEGQVGNDRIHYAMTAAWATSVGCIPGSAILNWKEFPRRTHGIECISPI